MQARRELLSKLTLSNKAIWDREHAREQIKSPLVIKVRRLVVLHYPIIHTRGNGNALGQGAQELKVTKLLLGDKSHDSLSRYSNMPCPPCRMLVSHCSSVPLKQIPYYALCWVLDVIFDGRPIQRFWLLETVARCEDAGMEIAPKLYL